MDLSCLGEVEKLYHERNGEFQPDDWKRFVPDREKVEKLKERLLRVRQDEESNNEPESNVVSQFESNDEKGKQPLRSRSA
jgi:hypothetical protein